MKPSSTLTRWSKILGKIHSIDASWIIVGDNEMFSTLYFGEKRSFSWDAENALLRCSLLVSDGDDADFACQIRFTPTAAVLKYDTDEGPDQIKLEIFEGKSGLLLHHSGRLDSVSIRISGAAD